MICFLGQSTASTQNNEVVYEQVKQLFNLILNTVSPLDYKYFSISY